MIHRTQTSTRSLIYILLSVILSAFTPSSLGAADSLDEMFINPPQIAKPQVWWHWMYGNVTKEGITKDLEQMQDIGIGGVTQFHNAWTEGGKGTRATPRGPVRFMSPEYRELVSYALKECERLDMTMGLQICDGFSQTGGPWITPNTGMRELRCKKLPVKGGKTLSYTVPDNTVLILAYPGTIETPQGEEAVNSPMIKPRNPYLKKNEGEAGTAIESNKFINLMAQLQADGTLTWDTPKGDWVVLVFHHVLNPAVNHPASPEGRGLECSKLNSDAVDLVYDKVVGPLIEDAGDLAGKTLKHVLIDSWECKYQSWSKEFAEEFKKRRGYDPAPYLPALAKIPVNSVEESNRFLCDFRMTLDDLLAEEYYGHVRDRLHEKGMQLHAEVLYGWDQMFGNSIRQYGICDVPMNEIWMRRNILRERAFTGYAATAGHVYGKSIIKDESFTVGGAMGDFSYVPEDLKSTADFLLCRGTTKFVLHTSTHQPYDEKPGWTHGWNGVNFHRGNTWWPYADGFVNYLGRTSYMLQQGLFVADVCRYVGHEDTFSKMFGEMSLENLPEGYRADHCDNTVLLERMDVKDGRIVLPDGMSYAVLLLADKKTMSPEVLQRLTRLVEKGATVIGPKPETAPGLTDYPQCDETVRKLADRLWGPCDGKTITESRFGKGRVVWGKPLPELLKEMKLQADFSYTTKSNKRINFIHRTLPDAEIYFIATAGKGCMVDCSFRVTGKQPELFDPLTGEVSDIAVYDDQDGRIRIPIQLEAQGSKIIVFRKNAKDSVVEIKHDGVIVFAPDKRLSKDFASLPATFKLTSDGSIAVIQQSDCGALEWKTAAGRKGKLPQARLPKSLTLSGPWNVRFEEGRGAPAEITLDKLASWSEHTDSGVRYFSGEGTYRKAFTLQNDFLKNTRISLDLGDVKGLAEVLVNGESAGTLWRSPFVIDITMLVQAGKNDLSIKVVNTWVNRLIGDKNVPKDERIGQIVPTDPTWYKATSPLHPSGLLGPIYIRASQEYILPQKLRNQ
ncbi:hypothetical protein PDESU_01976 [Pontiella desulfatans]|uniref:Uncharacterized protein n=1 Tax=Pontiella desulfatans TaxID=2750659 RepID=A0A6C2U0S3_PONDE|nr:glycosyl hydrolase [Pontiella desulfatans]VGO13419.1 hypothetical protein PDESU_01976 [Pontiella desulfatans]